MINPYELLRGSVVHFGDDWFTIYGVEESEGNDYASVLLNEFGGTTSKQIDPVELCPDILLQLGFLQTLQYPDIFNFTLNDLTINYDFDTQEISSIEIQGLCLYVDIKYVHRLQHLYFTLTNKFLEFKGFEYIG